MKQWKYSIFIGLVALVACGDSKESSGGEEADRPPPAVRLAEVERRDLTYYDDYPGTVSPIDRVEVRPQVSGYITAVHFEEGERVRQGQRLYSIDVRRYAADVNQAEAGIESARANAALAQRNVRRYRRLAEAEAIATQRLDQAEAELESRLQELRSAEAALNSAQTQVDYTTIRAPLSGLTQLGSAKVGTQVALGSPVLTVIVKEEPVGVDFALPQTAIPRLARIERVGAELPDSTFRLRLPDGSLYPEYGSIYGSDQAVDPQTGTLTVRLRFPNDENVLRNGMTVSVEMLNQGSGERLVIPPAALTEQMGEFYVFRVRDSTAYRQKVTTGDQIRDLRIVTDGLEAGDRIVVEGIKALRDSTRVRVVPPGENMPGQTAAGR